MCDLTGRLRHPGADLYRQLGVSDATCYAWKKQYAHLGVSELRRLRQLEVEHSRLKRRVAARSLDQHVGNWLAGFRTPSRSVAYGAVVWPSSVGRPDIDKAKPSIRLPCGSGFGILAQSRPRFGDLRIWVWLRREGWSVNRKRVRRPYSLDGLQMRIRVRRRKHIAWHRGPAPVPVGPTERWSMDFDHDTLPDGRPFRVLTVVDHGSRQSPVLEGGFRMSGATVGEAFDRILNSELRPRWITAPSSNLERWKIGPIDKVGNLTSFDPENPWKMRSLNRVTDTREMSG